VVPRHLVRVGEHAPDLSVRAAIVTLVSTTPGVPEGVTTEVDRPLRARCARDVDHQELCASDRGYLDVTRLDQVKANLAAVVERGCPFER